MLWFAICSDPSLLLLLLFGCCCRGAPEFAMNCYHARLMGSHRAKNRSEQPNTAPASAARMATLSPADHRTIDHPGQGNDEEDDHGAIEQTLVAPRPCHRLSRAHRRPQLRGPGIDDIFGLLETYRAALAVQLDRLDQLAAPQQGVN